MPRLRFIQVLLEGCGPFGKVLRAQRPDRWVCVRKLLGKVSEQTAAWQLWIFGHLDKTVHVAVDALQGIALLAKGALLNRLLQKESIETVQDFFAQVLL